MRRAVFLDRDGVVTPLLLDPGTGKLEGAVHPDELALYPGVVDAVRALRAGGFLVALASNQPGAARGRCGVADLDRIHERLVALLGDAGALDGYYYCLHDPAGKDAALAVRCDCRKPAPGLLRRAARELGVDLARSFMVGDRAKDLECGRAAGCRTVLVGAKNPVPPGLADHEAGDLLAAARWIAGA